MAAARAQATRDTGLAGETPLRIDLHAAWHCAGVMLLCLASSFAIIHATHECRKLYAGLQDLEAARWYLDEEYSRLLLEQSAWASHYRVEQVAERELSMQAPALDNQRILAR